MATTTTNYGFDVPTSSDLVKNGATQIALLGQDLDTFLFRPFSRNAMINGGCEVAQRGTAAVTLTAANFLYPVDRMFAGRSSGTTGATAQQIGSTTLTGFNNAVRVQRTAGNTSTNDLYIGQSMESLNSIPLAGQNVTLSFYARAGANYSAASSSLGVRLYSGTGTDQSGLGSAFTGTASPVSASQVITTSWVRYSFTATVSSTATQLQFLAFYTPVGTAGAADSFDITGVMLEVGSQVSPFNRSGGTIQGELAACQRYYYRLTTGDEQPISNQGYFFSSTAFGSMIPFKVQMRTAPTVLDFSQIAVSNYNGFYSEATGASLVKASAYQAIVNATGLTGGTTGSAYGTLVAFNAGRTGYVGLSAEL
jgi:hypothetical protein